MQFFRGKRARSGDEDTFRSPTTNYLSGDIDHFKRNGAKYLRFIDELRKDLSVSYDLKKVEDKNKVKVTKTDGKITKMKLTSGDSTVFFVYRHSDLYIIGIIVGSVFYVDAEVLGMKPPPITVGRLPTGHDWREVLGDVTVDSLSLELRYKDIPPERKKIPINKMGESLKKLTQVGDRHKKGAIVREHLAPFIIAFAEAVRFKVVALEVRRIFPEEGGEFDMKGNFVELTGVGHPDQRKPSKFDFEWLIQNWGKASEKLKVCYVDGKAPPPFVYLGEQLGLEKNQLNVLVGVATASAFPASRPKREVQWFNLPAQPVADPVGRIASEGDLQGTSKSMTSIAQHLDMVGSLHLIALGILHLSGRKMQNFEQLDREINGQEAQAIAADLVEKINCVTGAESDFEQDMEMQRELYGAMIRGSDVAKIMHGLVEQKLEEMETVDGAVRAIKLASGRKCF